MIHDVCREVISLQYYLQLQSSNLFVSISYRLEKNDASFFIYQYLLEKKSNHLIKNALNIYIYIYIYILRQQIII